MFLTFSDFVGIFPTKQIKEPEFSELERRAENIINTLTFNRITAQGFDSLTDFQKGLVRQATAKQVMFIRDNSELLDSPLSAYSISGVSMSFDKSKVVSLSGVTTTNEVYSLLVQTGLCYRGV